MEINDNGCLYPEVSDRDIIDAMKDFKGYIDITPADLKQIYSHAFRHAIRRLSSSVKAEDIMTTAVYYVKTDTPLRDVANIMSDKYISGVPVVDGNGRVAGIISVKDFLVRMGAKDMQHVMGIISACLEGKGCVLAPIRSRKAEDIMTSPAITVSPGTSAFDIADIFNNRHINRVPVVDQTGNIAGIVSRADIIRARLAGL